MLDANKIFKNKSILLMILSVLLFETVESVHLSYKKDLGIITLYSTENNA